MCMNFREDWRSKVNSQWQLLWMNQGREHDDSQHPGPGAHVRPPHRLPPGGKNVTEKERMSNISQSLTVRVVLQKTISKSNSTILLISKNTRVPMIGKNMFLTTQVICTILEFLFIYCGEICTFTLAFHILMLPNSESFGWSMKCVMICQSWKLCDVATGSPRLSPPCAPPPRPAPCCCSQYTHLSTSSRSRVYRYSGFSYS